MHNIALIITIEYGRIGLAKVVDNIVPSDVFIDRFHLGIAVWGLNPFA